jgi:hypothetical protein
VFIFSVHPAYVPQWVVAYRQVEPFGLVYEVKARKPEKIL